MNFRSVISALVLCVLLVPITTQAQISTVAGVRQVISRTATGAAAIKGTDSGYDPLNDAYLVVGSCYGSCVYGQVYGVFVDRGGQSLTNPFAISGGAAGHFPRARYAQELNGGSGGFLVTWLEEGSGGFNSVKVRGVAYPGTPLGSEAVLNDGNSYAWIESAAAVGYSPTSQRFLVAWRTYPHVSSAPHVAARLVDINGAPVESVIKLSAGFGRDPGIAWNSQVNVFGVSFGAENSAGSAGFSGFAVVPPVNGASFTRNSFNTISGFTYISDVDFNPDTGNFVMIWHQNMPGVPFEVRVAELNASAQVVSEGLVSRELPGYDAHSIGFNPISGTFGVSSIDGNDDIVMAELNSNGFRTSAVTLVGAGVTGRYPRIATSTEQSQWQVTFSNNFQSIVNLIAGTSSTGGGPSGSNGSSGGSTPEPTPTPTPTPTGCSTPQPGAGWTCVSGNWLPPTDGGSTGGSTTGGCPGTAPFPGAVCVSGNWIPGDTTSGGSTGGTTTGGCPGSAPFPGAVCVNGDWKPGDTTSGGSTGSTGGCPSGTTVRVPARKPRSGSC